jgi:beta-galactosidase
LGGFPGDGLKEVTGVWEEEIDAVYPEDKNSITDAGGLSGKTYPVHDYCAIIHPLENTEVLATYDDDFYQGMAAVTKHAYGKGLAYHIAARTEVDFLADFYKKIAEEISLENNFPGAKEVPDGVEIQKREGEDENYYFFMNFQQKEQKVVFSGSVDFTDVVTGEHLEVEKLEMKPYEVKVFSCKKKSK